MNVDPRMNRTDQAMVMVGVSRNPNTEAAVKEAVAQIGDVAMCFVMVLVPETLPPHLVATALKEALPATPVFGCTTAGQITPEGYEDKALMLVAFPKLHFRCSSELLSPLKPLSIRDVAEAARHQATRFRKTANWNRLALIFSDGLSKQEDSLVAALEAGLDDVPVYGGSAGHGLAFDETFVFHNGGVHSNAALLMVIETDYEVSGIGFDHFLPTEKQMIVTSAEPEERLVSEINGAPAAEEYARLIGCTLDELSPEVFSENPVLVRNQNAWHVRAIQGVADNNALSFLCAIDDGLLLTLGRSSEIIATLDRELSVASSSGKPPGFILGFDCVLRKLEVLQKNLQGEVSNILVDRDVIGFNTYGEQHLGVHVNQTFVGVAFFPPKEERGLD